MAERRYEYYVGCEATDFLEGTTERLSDVISSVLASCELECDTSLDDEGIFNYTCEQMKLAIQRRGGGSCLQLGGMTHKFSSSGQLVTGLDHVVKAIVGATLAETSAVASLKLGIKSILETSANQVDHVNNAKIIFWNFQKAEMNYRSSTVTVIWNKGNSLTITPVLIKVDGTKTATKILWYENEEMSGSISIKQCEFNFTRGYCLNAVEEFQT
jgi:hypothetical protein